MARRTVTLLYGFILLAGVQRCTAEVESIRITACEANESDCEKDLDFLRHFTQFGNDYYLVDDVNRVNWFAANEICRSNGGFLISFATKREVQSLNDLITLHRPKLMHIWTAYNDLSKEGTFVSSVTGGLLPDGLWGEGEPNNKDNAEHCVQIAFRQYFNDISCNTLSGYICKISPPKIVSFEFA